MQYSVTFSALKIENFNGKYFIFILFLPKTDCGYMLEPPGRGSSNEYPQFMFWIKNEKKIGIPLHTPVLLYKSGVYITRKCYPGVHWMQSWSKLK